jgi:chorismate dehydratase
MTLQQTSEIRVGVVPFLNAAPLIQGISSVEGIELIRKVPSELISALENDEVDIALASSIDYQRSSIGLGILPVGVLSSDGNSLTVQLCSRTTFQHVSQVYCDSDSHTSVALLQIVLKKLYDISVEIVPTNFHEMGDCNSTWPEAVLLIGDKVVTSQYETQYAHTLDLGQAWKEQTGLPFVFATWLCRLDLPKMQTHKLAMVLQRQLAFNHHRIEQVVSISAPERNWDTVKAHEYVTKNMYYRFTDMHLESLQLFYSLAASAGVLETVRPIQLLDR